MPASALVLLADADAFQPSLGLARREAAWALKGLRDVALSLFEAADERDGAHLPEISEERVSLKPLTAGGEVVADYSNIGLTLRAHPVSFLREKLKAGGIVTCREAEGARDGRFVKTGGIVLVRQRPGSAKGVMFITIEDETGVANLVIWAATYEKFRRIILTSGMLKNYGDSLPNHRRLHADALLVPQVGLEPTRPHGQQILSLPRLPFRHWGAGAGAAAGWN